MREDCYKFGFAPLGLRKLGGAIAKLTLETQALGDIAKAHYGALQGAIGEDLRTRIRHRDRSSIFMQQYPVVPTSGFRVFQYLADGAFRRRLEGAPRMNYIVQHGAD
jgi:hypothetical protein